jgi:nanoRNase/pAp phosphatase (c-di-AMP/oligoRNAs hydrolase)
MIDRAGENARRVHELRAFAQGTRLVPILVQRDPDPDGMASALGIRTLLHRADAESPIISLGEVTRAENRRMAELLGLQVTQVTVQELYRFDRVIAVDTQPSSADNRTRYAVVDHHPPRDGYTADFVDIRPHLGAASTMVTQYLRVADERRITARVATALAYGIRTDTDVLRRGTTSEDVEAYAFLQGRADQELLSRIGRPAFPETGVRALGQALANMLKKGDIAVAYVGRLDDPTSHLLPNLADFCLGIEGVSWSAAAGRVGDELVINTRRVGSGPGAGELAANLAEEPGMGGGHHAMRRVAIRLTDELRLSDQAGDPESMRQVLDRVVAGVEALRAPR